MGVSETPTPPLPPHSSIRDHASPAAIVRQAVRQATATQQQQQRQRASYRTCTHTDKYANVWSGLTGVVHWSHRKQIHIKWHFRGPTATTRARTLIIIYHTSTGLLMLPLLPARAHRFPAYTRSTCVHVGGVRMIWMRPRAAHRARSPLGGPKCQNGMRNAITFLNVVKFDKSPDRPGQMRYAGSHILRTACKCARFKVIGNEWTQTKNSYMLVCECVCVDC